MCWCVIEDILVKKFVVGGVLMKIIIRVNKKTNITIELVTIENLEIL